MSDIEAEISAADHIPSSKKFLIHVFFDLLGHLLLVRTVLHRMVDHVLGLELNFRLHFRVGDLHSPLLSPLVHSDYL